LRTTRQAPLLPIGVVGDLAALALQGHRLVAGGRDQIELGDEAQALAAQGHRTADLGRLLAAAGGRRGRGGLGPVGVGQHVVHLIDAAVHLLAVEGEGVVGPAALDMHEVHAPRAIGELVKLVEGEQLVRRRTLVVGSHPELPWVPWAAVSLLRT
jgi:hypothetical protein